MAFELLAKRMPMAIVRYLYSFDHFYMKYLKELQDYSWYKIAVDLTIDNKMNWTNVSILQPIIIFCQFLEYCLKNHIEVLFEEIKVPWSTGVSSELIKCYRLLKQMKKGQEKVMLRKWQLSRWNSDLKDEYNKHYAADNDISNGYSFCKLLHEFDDLDEANYSNFWLKYFKVDSIYMDSSYDITFDLRKTYENNWLANNVNPVDAITELEYDDSHFEWLELDFQEPYDLFKTFTTLK